MKEKIVKRNDEKVVEVRSDGGKLLFIKTKEGYEMKCSRTKQICTVKYDTMIQDYFTHKEDVPHVLARMFSEYLDRKKKI